MSGNSLNLKRIIILVVTLLFGMIVFPNVISKSVIISDVITVDDEGDGDYTSIKEALNNATPGDTIEVYSGIYNEYNITILTQDVILKGISHELGNGNDTGKPFIDGKDHSLFFVRADGITISGFHIENEGDIACDTIGLNGVKNCVISNNDVSHTLMSSIYCKDCFNISIINNNLSFSAIRQGISFHNCNSFAISGNIITDCWLAGIEVWSSDNNTIEGNTISECGWGIEVIGKFNKVVGNTIKDNRYGLVVYDIFNVIEENNFRDNQEIDAFFYLTVYTFPFRNTWSNNYWGRPRVLPKPIVGFVIGFIPWVQFDWRPALIPHNI